jgi:hypothetical protein
MERIKAFLMGVREGFASPIDLCFGMSWDDAAISDSYDYGANIGQALGRVILRLRGHDVSA